MIFKHKNILPQLKITLLLDLKSLALVFSFCLFISSCGEDPVRPINGEYQTPVVDSNIFDWEYKMLPGYHIYDLYIEDTSSVFLMGIPSTLYYDGNDFTTIMTSQPSFYPICINGWDRNNVYIGGENLSTGHSMLKKWNGSSIEDIPLPQDSSKWIDYIYMEGVNDIWLSTFTNKVYHYDGSNIVTYLLPVESMRLTGIYGDQSGALFLFGLNTSNIYSSFKFQDNNWMLVKRDTMTESNNLSFRVLQCGADILRTGVNNIFKFVGNEWITHLPAQNMEQISISGASKNDFLVWARGPSFGMPVYYNGEKFMRQTDFENHGLASQKNLFKYKSCVYYGCFPGDLFNNALIIASFKK